MGDANAPGLSTLYESQPISWNDLVARPGGLNKGFYLDGDYSVAQPCGAMTPVFPFLEQGDTTTVIFQQKYEQALTAYRPPALTKPLPGIANCYPLGDINFRDGGCGIAEFERTFGNIPAQRVRRGQSHTYAFQYILSSGVQISGGDDSGGDDSGGGISYEGPTYTLGTLAMKVDSRIQYDYFLAGNEGKFPLLQAPQVIQVGQKIQSRGVDLQGGSFPLYLSNTCLCARNGADILAEDDSYADWKGAIRCRVRRIIAGPTPQFWLANVH